MKHLVMAKPTVKSTEDSSETVRYTSHEYGQIKEVKSSKKCCVCEIHIWLEERGNAVFLREAFKVMSSLAYVGGLPDYLKQPNVLHECHYTCELELIKRLEQGHYLDKK